MVRILPRHSSSRVVGLESQVEEFLQRAALCAARSGPVVSIITTIPLFRRLALRIRIIIIVLLLLLLLLLVVAVVVAVVVVAVVVGVGGRDPPILYITTPDRPPLRLLC